MTAPTTRETADHIGEANEKVAMKPDDILAILRADRLPECSFDNGMTWVTDDVIVAETFTRTADALENLLSEIAALRGERDDLKRHRDRLAITCQRRLDDWRGAQAQATQAERQRDEAVGLLRRYRSDLPTEALEDLTDAFLANPGADQ